jgi:streptogramin lyase
LLGEYIIPTPNSYPQGIAFGPDGNMWFTERSANKIGRITTAGRFTEFAVPQSSPWGLASGPDGNIWVALSGSDRIARVTPRGHITEFQVPNAATHPISVAAGPDGNVWFSEEFPTYQIGRITPSGAITEFPLPSSDSDADSLVAGPDGAVWFGDGGSGKIGRIGTDGTITEFPVPGSSVPEGIAVGSDQNIWFTDNRANKIGRLLIDPATTTPAPPVFANAIDATVVGGEVTVQVPGSTHFEPLTRPEQVHVGATIDARAGRVRIVIVDARGKTWTADFYGGVFKITQLAAEGGVAQLALTGGHFAACVRTGRSAIAAAQRKRSAKSIRHLWASGSGPFRTLGHYASAAIRGTTWDTDDRCDGTLVKVKQGSVTVRDLVRKKTVVVRAHGQYLAKVR